MNFDMFRGIDYEPQDAEDEIFLSEIPLSLLISSIESQFQNPMEHGKNDFIQSFQTKYQVTKENMTEDDEEEVDALYTKFMSSVLRCFKEYLGLGFPEIDDLPEEDQLEQIHYVYRYFIINIKKNFTNFLLEYIDEHMEELSRILPKKKDVTTFNLKRVIEDDNIISIITNIDRCIDIILNSEITVGQFITMSHGDKSNLECDYIDEMYDNVQLTGNFVPHYVKILNDEFRVEIECKVRNRFLKRYRKK